MSSSEVLPALLTDLLCLVWALTWLQRDQREDIAGRGAAGVGNSQGLQTVLCLHVGHMSGAQPKRKTPDLGSPQELQKYQDRMKQKEALSLGRLGAFKVK